MGHFKRSTRCQGQFWCYTPVPRLSSILPGWFPSKLQDKGWKPWVWDIAIVPYRALSHGSPSYTHMVINICHYWHFHNTSHSWQNQTPPFTSPIPATPSSLTPGSNTLSNTLFKGSVYTVWGGCVNCYRVVKAAGYWEQRVMWQQRVNKAYWLSVSNDNICMGHRLCPIMHMLRLSSVYVGHSWKQLQQTLSKCCETFGNDRRK